MKIIRVNDNNVDDVLSKIDGKSVGFDLETSNTCIDLAHVSVIQMYSPEYKESYLFPIDVIDATLSQQGIRNLCKVYERVSVTGHNLYYDIQMMYKDFKCFPAKIEDDTYILAMMTQAPNKKLKALAIQADPSLAGKIKMFEDVMGFDRDNLSEMSKNGTGYELVYSFQNKSQVLYMALDPYLPFVVKPMLYRDSLKRAYDLELGCIPILAMATVDGLHVDNDKYREALFTLASEIEPLQSKVDSLVGYPIKVNSVAQVQKALWEDRKLPQTPIKTSKGLCSTSEESLKYLEGDELVDAILALKHLISTNSSSEKAKNYFDSDNNVHPQFQTIGFDEATSRIYTTNPSVNQWPWELRGAIVPSEGKKFVHADWSSAELYIACYFANQQNILTEYAQGKDIHSYLSGLLLGVENPNKEQRNISKVLTFATMYGSEGGAVERKLRCSESEAKELVSRYLRILSNVKDLRDKIQADAVKTHMTATVFGRPRALVNFNDPTKIDKAKRQAFNTMIQGSCADLQKAALKKLFDIMKEDSRIKFKFTVFDSFLLEVDESVSDSDIESVLDRISDFSDIFPGFKLRYSYGVGYDWYSAERLS